MMTNVLLCITSAAVSWLVIWLMIVNAVRLGMVQAPVARSSHKKPTPTGGGIGIVVGAVPACLFFAGSDPVAMGVCGLGVVIALLGLIDDRTPLPASVRFLVQASAVAAAIYLSSAAADFFGSEYGALWPLAFTLLLLAGVWWINLFNFMDGIDGIAGQQSVMMLGAAMLVIWSDGIPLSSFWWMMAAIVVSTLSFLALNWPPARIFMGDAGSTFLAFMLFAFALVSMSSGWLTVPQWLLLASLFAVDATVTLLVRFIRGENVTQAHRSHAYQRLSRKVGGALPVTGAAIIFNLVFVLPVTAFLPASPIVAYGAVAVVYVLLAVGCLWVGAGLRDDETGGHFGRGLH
ncbi:glycosyltransferase family 4 protein [Neorhizobium sp. JUb45]|uniref:MraY family glycosyltransferase n=1 Tax=unclassified Neorhizobium TaxID=2629175 RepID=UPI001047595B|nr:glycosyltransferase family 4 protein [Neorhizobium sp. JUb45]TCQ99683.1 Fuc2NAc and GlcNAc transferase [Neorhizobium sp. JUb45]